MKNWYKLGGVVLAATPLGAVYAFKHKEGHDHRREKKSSKNIEDRKWKATAAVKRFQIANGIPGISVGVSVDGKPVERFGVGFANLEQLKPCTADTVMRIASISKPISAVIAAQLVEAGKLDVDAPVQKYVPSFPKKTFDGKPVEITARQLLSQSSGIRHYEDDKNFYLNKEFKTSLEALDLFKDDPLVAAPGTKYNYTTYGYTLLGAVLEAVSETTYKKLVYNLTTKLGMTHTRLDSNSDIVPNRSLYYKNTDENDKNKLINVPEVDNSYKYAGGGLLSTVDDLLTFGNAVLYSTQANEHANPPALLKQETVQKLLQGEVDTGDERGTKYAWGFVVSPKIEQVGGSAPNRTGYFSHTGGAMGAASVLMIRPNASKTHKGKPQGVVVAILFNKMDPAGSVTDLALEISDIYSNVDEQ